MSKTYNNLTIENLMKTEWKNQISKTQIRKYTQVYFFLIFLKKVLDIFKKM